MALLRAVQETLPLATCCKSSRLEDAEGFFEAFAYARQKIGAWPPVIDLTTEAETAWRTDDGEDRYAPTVADPFEKAGSPAAIIAYVYARMSADGLIALLSQVVTDKESLEQDAAELNAVGLPDVATIVLEVSASALAASICIVRMRQGMFATRSRGN